MRLIERVNLLSELKTLPEQERLEIMGVYDLIKSMPTIEAEPVVHGHWNANKANVKAMQEFHKKGIGLSMSEKSIYWTCSECNSWGTPIYKRCPWCGAKMDEEKE